MTFTGHTTDCLRRRLGALERLLAVRADEEAAAELAAIRAELERRASR